MCPEVSALPRVSSPGNGESADSPHGVALQQSEVTTERWVKTWGRSHRHVQGQALCPRPQESASVLTGTMFCRACNSKKKEVTFFFTLDGEGWVTTKDYYSQPLAPAPNPYFLEGWSSGMKAQGQLGLQGEQKLGSASHKEGRKGKGERVNSSCTENFECHCFCYIEKLGTVTPST